jgi:hypothetical protein
VYNCATVVTASKLKPNSNAKLVYVYGITVVLDNTVSPEAVPVGPVPPPPPPPPAVASIVILCIPGGTVKVYVPGAVNSSVPFGGKNSSQFPPTFVYPALTLAHVDPVLVAGCNISTHVPL